MSQPLVLVTGASRGIGRAIALFFAQKGYSLVLNCKQNKEALSSIEKELLDMHVPYLSFIGDIGNHHTAQKLFECIEQTFHKNVDILINNAGISYVGLLTDMSIDDWDQIISTNLTSVFNCSKLAIPGMVKKRSGKIINISSVWGNAGASCEVAYSATKGAINSFTKALGKELAPSNIQVNAIACGAIDTEMNQFLSDEDRTALTDEIPACRFGKPEEVAAMVYQVATSPEYLTSQIITLDGGWI